jgi:hypothetical protein
MLFAVTGVTEFLKTFCYGGHSARLDWAYTVLKHGNV